MEFDQDELDVFLNNKPKSKSMKIFYLVSSLIIFIIVIWFFVSPEENETTFYEEKVTRYLLNEKGYKEGDIKSIEEHGGIGHMPPRYVKVIFNNEPYVEYIYYAHHTVKQASYYINDEKYKGLTEEDLKNIDPNGLIDSQ